MFHRLSAASLLLLALLLGQGCEAEIPSDPEPATTGAPTETSVQGNGALRGVQDATQRTVDTVEEHQQNLLDQIDSPD